MINIQIHDVIRVSWTPPRDKTNPFEPRTLEITTSTGTQEITLFLARPAPTDHVGSEDDGLAVA